MSKGEIDLEEAKRLKADKIKEHEAIVKKAKGEGSENNPTGKARGKRIKMKRPAAAETQPETVPETPSGY
eukprot:9484910-Pyramimonas_sp.AAC.1